MNRWMVANDGLFMISPCFDGFLVVLHDTSGVMYFVSAIMLLDGDRDVSDPFV